MPIALFAAVAFSSCTFTDAFSTGSGDDPAPRPTATATPVPEPEARDRERPGLRHRYVVTPPEDDYDADLIPVAIEDQLLEDAAARWAETESVRFELDVDGTTYLDVNETIELDSVEGVLQRPNEAEAEASIKIGFATFDVGLIAIGDDVYTTNFLNGDWERGPDNFNFNPALIFDDEQGVSAVLDALDDVEAGEETEIGGTEVIEVSGTIAQDQIDQLVAGSLEGDEISVSLWIAVDTGDLLQIRLSEPDDVDGDPIAWVISFSDHNEPVTIEAPDI